MVTKATPRLPQPPLFVLEESTGRVELFPAVWSALEDLTMPEAKMRREALDRLLELNAPRFSPIAAYVLVTRLTDPDLELRARIVQALGEALLPDAEGHPAPEEVRDHLVYHLSQARTRQVFALLQVAEKFPAVLAHAARLLDACPYAGKQLLDILSDHKAPLEIRIQAATLIGQVGYLDALPALERLSSRLEARQAGQSAMPFLPPASSVETALLPAIQAAIARLRAP